MKTALLVFLCSGLFFQALAEDCGRQLGESCNSTSDCCSGYCNTNNKLCSSEPCWAIKCTAGYECVNWDNCNANGTCSRQGSCIRCTRDGCQCQSSKTCDSGCCVDETCVANPNYSRCNGCCMTKCPKGSRCSLQVVYCIRAPCPPLPICVKDPENKSVQPIKCPEGQIYQIPIDNTCDPTVSDCIPGICVIPAKC